ncbi:homoserine dehydrogenase [Candidatus Poribacteria bacterium]|nr:homoserine dehydrogenase [Candidatus Poribacteria bacterium]
MKEHEIKVGVIGWGTVGSGVVKILVNQDQYMMKPGSFSIKLGKIADLDITTPRDTAVDPSLLTTRVSEIIEDREIDIVVETIGGLNPATDFIRSALKAGKHVVTANKAVLALYSKELFKIAKENKVRIGFEASVGGCIPIIRSLREGLVSNRIQAIYGIVNGTSNYILSEMTDKGMDFSEALKEAQERGYAEADPSSDIEGIDAANKIAILTSLAYESDVKLDSVFVEGVTRVTQRDIQYASELGYRIKLLAIAKLVDNNKLQVRVHPTMLPERSMLASVEGVFNAIYVVGNATGSTMFYGRGAGQMPAASAVLSDIVDISKTIAANANSQLLPSPVLDNTEYSIKPVAEIETRYYIRVQVLDSPGVLAQISGILGDNSISISSVIQKERREGKTVPIVMMTHEAVEKNMQNALKEIDALSVVTPKSMLIRVETMDGEEDNLAIV